MAITNGDLAGRMGQIEEKLDQIASAVDGLAKTVAHHGLVIDEAKQIAAETREMVEAWRTAKGVGKFLKWGGGILAAVAGATGALVAAWKGLRS
jgi:hypothetical protein